MESALFDSTINLISNSLQEPGVRDEILANNVIKLVYNVPDSMLPIEDKLDLIFLVNKFERHAYRVLCNKVTHGFSNDSAIKYSNKLFLIPLCDCEYAVNPILRQIQPIDTAELHGQIERLTKDYQNFFNALEKRIITSMSQKQNKPYIVDYFVILKSMDGYYKRKYALLFN